MKKVLLIVSFLLLVFSCKEQGEIVDPVEKSTESFTTIHYIATASSQTLSKASVNGSTQYIFESGDRLFISHKESGEDKLFGFLSLVSGAGERVARFEGDIFCAEDFELSASTAIDVTLVSSSDLIHSTSGGIITGPVSYPSNAYAPDLATAVQKYSDFTCTSTFGSTRFTLTQNSTFIVCSIIFPAEDLPDATSVTASLVGGGSSVWEGTVTSVVNGLAAKLNFVIPFEGGSVTLSSASLSLEWTDALDTHQSQNFDLTPHTLAANNYYTVERSTIYFDGFHIKATANDTKITFNYYYDPDGIEYSFDEGLSWTHYTEPFTLKANEEICVRGNRANYANNGGDAYGTPSGTPIFTATKKVYISGNIMSLLADKNNLVASAFHGAFSKGSSEAVDYIDINPNRDLILPITALQTSCYQQMFRNCTSLTKTPTFRVEGTAYRCCYNMFRQCSNLADASGIELPATTLAIDCYRELFRQCGKLETIAQDFLPATTLAQGCYQQMFQATKIATAPVLPAPTLVKDCYSEMFRSCSSLQNVTCLATNISASNCLSNWLTSVKSTGTFYKDPNMSGWNVGSNVPSGWVISDYPPTP